MPHSGSLRSFPTTRLTRLAQLLVVTAVVALAAITNASSPRKSARTTAVADVTPAQDQRPPVSGSPSLRATVGAGGVAPAATIAPVVAWPGAHAAGALLHTAATAVALDTPIQGGLTAHQEQALSARLRSTHRVASLAPQAEYWTPAMGRSAVARATSWLGMPYSWAAGNASGPTVGRCDASAGGDLDCHVIGFDCSGLTLYAWGSYLALPHLAATQRDAGAFHPTVKQLLPGDLVFFSAYLPGGTGHVAIYAGNGMIVEAPQSGSALTRATLADAMAQDGIYRGAVRPLTGRTPTLTTPHVTVSPTGATVTLRGAHLANVDAVQVGGVTVRRFMQHSDSAIVFHAPAHHSGAVGLTATTSWHARSRSVTLTYAQPRPASSAAPSPVPTPSTAPSSTPAGSRPSSDPTPSKSAVPSSQPTTAARTPRP